MKTSPLCLAFLLSGLGSLAAASAPTGATESIVQKGFEGLRHGSLGDGGADTYVSATGNIETIHRRDLNRDGEIDLVFTQDHNADYAPDAMIYWGSLDGPASLQPELPQYRSPYALLKYAENALKKVTWLPSLGGGRCQVADLNNDGYPDIISGNMMHNFRQDMPAYIYWGSAQGFHESDRTILPAYIASGIAVGDLNEDGLPDVVIANQGYERGFDLRFGAMLNSRESFIYWGHSAGFDVSRRLSLPTISAADVAIGDFNGDKYLDVAFVNNLREEQSIYIYWGDGTGKFSEASRQVIKIAESVAGQDKGGLEMHTAFAADLNKDGRADLVVSGKSHALVFLGTKDGLNAVPASDLPADNSNAVEAADLNHDGWPDLVVANAGTEPAQPKSVIYWGGEKGFSTEHSTALSTLGAMAVKAGDLNHDGFPDLVFGNLSMSKGAPAQIFWGSANGYSDYRRRELQAFGAIGIGLADFDRDGNQDLVLLNHLSSSGETALPTSIYWGNKEHAYSDASATHLQPGGYMMYTCADFDDDGWPDLVTVHAGHASVWWGSATGFTAENRTELPIKGMPGDGNLFGLNVADLDHDGHLDLVCTGWKGSNPAVNGPSAVIVYGGTDRFKTARTEVLMLPGSPGSMGSSTVTIADLNQDGYLDMIFPLQDIGLVQIRWGGPEGYASARVTNLETNGASAATVADLDHDGRLDLVLTSGLMGKRKPGEPVVGGTGVKGTTRNSQAYIYWGNAAWDGSEHTAIECYNALDVTVADLNRDGHLDLAFGSYMSDTTRELPAIIYWGDGTRGFSEKRRTFIDAASSSSVDALDLNRDGWLDLIVTNHQKNFSHFSGSNIYWGGKKGYSIDNRTHLPSIGAHLDMMVDAGNISDRKLEWDFVSTPIQAVKGMGFDRLNWKAETELGTGVKFQVRSAATQADLAQAAWTGPEGANSYYTASGTKLAGVKPENTWLQFRAVLTSPDGGNSPQLSEVEIVCAHP